MGAKNNSCHGNGQWVPHSRMVPRKDRMQLPWQLHLLWKDRYCPVALATTGSKVYRETLANSLGSLSQWMTIVSVTVSLPLLYPGIFLHCLFILPLVPLLFATLSIALTFQLGEKCRGDTRILERTAWLRLTPSPHSYDSWFVPETPSATSPNPHSPRGTMEIWSPGAHVPVSACASSQGERGKGSSRKGRAMDLS